MTKMENAEPGYGRKAGHKDIDFKLDQNTAFIMDAKPSSKAEVLKDGTYVRIVGAAPQTINVIEPIDPIRTFPGAYLHSSYGTILGYDPATKTVTALIQTADGKIEKRSMIARKHVSLDSHFLPRTSESRFRLNEAFQPGREAFFFCHRRSKDPNEVYIQSVRPREVKGRLEKVEGNTLTLTTWKQGKLEQLQVKIEDDARIRYNYKDTPASEAFKPGSWVHIMPGHPMQLMAGRWDDEITPETKAPPAIQNVEASTPISGQVQLTWPDSAGLGLPTVAYQIYRDGEFIGNSATGSYLDTGLKEQTTFTYTVKAINRWGNSSDEGSKVSVKTMADTIAPKSLSFKADSEKNIIELLFDEKMNPKTLSNETIKVSDAVRIESVQMAEAQTSVTLSTSPLEYGQAYEVQITNATDASIAGNKLILEVPIKVTAWPQLKVTNVEVSSGKKYRLSTLRLKERVFIDRKNTISEASEQFLGQTMIMTSGDDKKFQRDGTLNFTVNRPVRVSVMTSAPRLDSRFIGFKLRNID